MISRPLKPLFKKCSMIQSERDYSEEIANLCNKHNVKYLGLHGSSYDQENVSNEDREINFLVEFFPMELKQYAKCYFALLEELEYLFGCNVNIVDIGDIALPELLRQLTKRKTDIYKA